MAINTYCGLQGSGKSYEVVTSVILDAVAHGRRIVTNVAGIDEDRIHEYLVNKRDADPNKLGSVVHVGNERILEPQFFPDEEKPELETVVRGGDLVAIDEAWRFWGTDLGKLSHEHMQFFRLHRHYVHPETKVTCDVVLMTQDITGLHRSLKNVVEFTFRMHKHKSLGFSSRYRVEIYEGWKLNAKTRIDDRQKKYDPVMFPLYQSYQGGKGAEEAIDKRQNLLANTTLRFYAAGVILMMSVSGFFAWRFFHRGSTASVVAVEAKNDAVLTKKAESANRENTIGAVGKSTVSDVWRVVGEFQSADGRWVVVANAAGKLRVESPSVFHQTGAAVVGDIDGLRVTRWSGANEKVASSPVVQVGK